MAPTLQLSVGVSFDKNMRFRRTMEDAHIIQNDFLGVPGQGFFVVLDGHAGKQAAEYCEKHLTKIFSRLMETESSKSVPELFDMTFTELDKQLQANNILHPGATVVAAFIRLVDGEYHLYTANAGDARAILCRDGQAVRLSYDHKASDPQEHRRIVETGGFIIKERVNGTLAITRALGDIPMKEHVISHPYTTETKIKPIDEFLILACDGVWDVMTDQQAVDLIRENQDPQAACDVLLKDSLQRGTTDNLTVMVIRFNRSE